MEETQAGIKIAGRNINNLRYADDTTLTAESEEELKSLLMKVKVESEKVDLKLNIQKTKIMASGPITSWQIDGETVETVSDFIFLGSKITADGDCSHEIKRKKKPKKPPQHSENEDHGIWSHHFMGNRWGNSGNSVRLYFGGAPKSLQIVTAAMKLKDAYSLEEKL